MNRTGARGPAGARICGKANLPEQDLRPGQRAMSVA
jgi:hypothetical protein